MTNTVELINKSINVINQSMIINQSFILYIYQSIIEKNNEPTYLRTKIIKISKLFIQSIVKLLVSELTTPIY